MKDSTDAKSATAETIENELAALRPRIIAHAETLCEWNKFSGFRLGTLELNYERDRIIDALAAGPYAYAYRWNVESELIGWMHAVVQGERYARGEGPDYHDQEAVFNMFRDREHHAAQRLIKLRALHDAEPAHRC